VGVEHPEGGRKRSNELSSHGHCSAHRWCKKGGSCESEQSTQQEASEMRQEIQAVPPWRCVQIGIGKRGHSNPTHCRTIRMRG
jgi:hypothetical protein